MAAISSGVRACAGARPARRRGRVQDWRQQQQPVGEPDCLVDVVRHQQRRDRAAVDELGQLLAQPCRKRVIERHERLVEQQQIGLDREGARQRHAARQPERKLAGIMIAMRREPQRLRTARRARHRSPAARRAARSARPCATAAAAAPGTPCRACRAPGSSTLPSKSRSSPAMIRSSVVLPQPDGPTSAATSPLARLNASSPSTWSCLPTAAR